MKLEEYQQIMKRMMRNILSIALALSMVVAALLLVTEKSMAVGTSHERTDDNTIQWIIDQIRTENSGYASDYIANRVDYLLTQDKYGIGTVFPFRNISDSVITDHQTQKDINLQGAECYGYAKYVYFMLFGSFDGQNVEKTLTGLHAGANVRTNSATKVDKDNKPYVLSAHSFIYLCRDNDGTGFYCLDANWSVPILLADKTTQCDNIIRVEHWTDKDFNATFSNGIQSITEPRVYPRVGDYSAAADISYYLSPNESNSAGVVGAGTVLHVTNLDAEHITDETRVKYENQSLKQISFRAIMAQANTPDGSTVWIVFNEPNTLQYSGGLTSPVLTTIASGEVSSSGFLQSIGNFFQSIQHAVMNFFRDIVSPVFAATEDNQTWITSNGNATAGNATAGNSAVAEATQVPGAASASETRGNPIQDGTFIISLNPNEAEIGDFDRISSDSDPYQTTPVNGGYLLKCAVCEFVTISYDEYNRIAAGETIQTAAGEIGHAQDISEYGDIGFYADAPIIFNEGRYFINKIPDESLPELLRDPYQEIWTNAGNEGYPILSGAQQCEYFISDETMVELFDFADASVIPFGDYLVFGNSDMIWSYTFLVTVQNNEIIRLQEIYAAIDD